MRLPQARRPLAVLVSLAFLLAVTLQLAQPAAAGGYMSSMAGCHDPIADKCPDGMGKADEAAKVLCESLCVALVATLSVAVAQDAPAIGADFEPTSAVAVTESIPPDTSPPRA
jgi:hypothetical protein